MELRRVKSTFVYATLPTLARRIAIACKGCSDHLPMGNKPSWVVLEAVMAEGGKSWQSQLQAPFLRPESKVLTPASSGALLRPVR